MVRLIQTNGLSDRSWRRRVSTLGLLATCVANALEVNPGHIEDVVVTAPLPGAVAAETEVPVNVSRLSGRDLAARSPWSLAQALGDMADGVSVNDTQGNPFQLDVDFRGFSASPVLGTPQGLSVFIDGVRVNDAFGDTVNWQLIPQSAIAGIELMPGSNPIFGLNTLGGAVIVTTKRGAESPQSQFGLEGGSFARRSVLWEAGGQKGRFDGYASATAFEDDGWARHNQSQLRQGFAKVGFRDCDEDWSLSLTKVRSALAGNQTLPQSWSGDRRESYTWPDTQADDLTLVALNATHHGARGASMSGNAYMRSLRSDTSNSNVNDAYDSQFPVGPGNQPTGNALEHSNQDQHGVAVQWSMLTSLMSQEHALVLGADFGRGITNFKQWSQEAGATRDTTSQQPRLLRTSLQAESRSTGVYASDLVRLSTNSFLSLAGRYTSTALNLQDQLGTELNGAHAYHRFNPAIGLTFTPTSVVPQSEAKLFLRYEEGMRTPTPVELTCADPAAPCSLPNAFAADPPLEAVISRTMEAGGRRMVGSVLFTGTIFRTELDHDIQFVASGGGAISAGYFRNVGKTRRQGLDLRFEGTHDRIGWSVAYTDLLATYRAPLLVNSPNHSQASAISCALCAEIPVRSGDRIPGIPRRIVKARLRYDTGKWEMGLSVSGQSAQFARGDENNGDARGPLPGFVLVQADFRRDLGPHWRFHARIDNLLDRRYSNFAVLGRNVFTGPAFSFDATGQTWRSEQFRTTGAPRGVWVGFTWHGSE